MPHSAIAVFTANSRDEILAVGGSAAWVVAEKQARRREFLVCIRNARDVDFPDHEPHGTAFLVGRISGLKPYGTDKRGCSGLSSRSANMPWSITLRNGASGATPSNTPLWRSLGST